VIDLLFTAHELISISKDGTLAFWELSTGECTRSLDVSCLNPGTNTRLHLSGDGRRLVVDSDAINSPVYIYDMKTGQLLHKYDSHSALTTVLLHLDVLQGVAVMILNHVNCNYVWISVSIFSGYLKNNNPATQVHSAPSELLQQDPTGWWLRRFPSV